MADTGLSRRVFMKRSLSAAAAAVPLAVSAAERKPTVDEPLPVVDTHQHLWDLSKFTLPWLKDGGPQELNRSFVMRDYLAATDGLNVVKTVYMEVNVAPEQQTREAEFVVDLCRRDDNPMAAAVVGGSPQDAGFAEYAKKFAASPEVKGVRTVLHDPDRPKGMCLEPRFVENMRLLGELGLRFDLCMRPGELLDGVRLAEKCPMTRFVVDHCGNMPVTGADAELRKRWADGIRAAAGRENTVCKISGIVVTAEKGRWRPADLAENVGFCLDAFGEDRVFFGGDWPVCTLKATFAQWLGALKEITADRSPESRRKLFHDNATRFYGLAD
jgi:predicted TIM-barrel fold metal-dependent hydrolase